LQNVDKPQISSDCKSPWKFCNIPLSNTQRYQYTVPRAELLTSS